MSRLDSPRLFCVTLAAVLGIFIGIERIAPLVLPPSAFLFRPWEYMTGGFRFSIPHAKTSLTMQGFGDLSNMLALPQYRSMRTYQWTNDAYGFRNDPSTQHAKPDVLVVGDSFMASAADSDSDAFTTALQRKTPLAVTAYAPADMSAFLRDPRFQKATPRYVVWGRVERNISGDNGELALLSQDHTCFAPAGGLHAAIDATKTAVKQTIGPLMEYVHLSLLSHVLTPFFVRGSEAVTGQRPPGVQIGSGEPPMLFFDKGIHLLSVPARDRDYPTVVAAVSHVQDCLKQRGSTLIFLPVPDKEHVYHTELGLPLLTPDSIDALVSQVSAANVPVVAIRSDFTKAVASGALLYWPDDTHWNKNGIDIAATNTAKILAIIARGGSWSEK